MEEQEIVKNSILKIFRECGFAESSKMTQRDFEFVSAEIEKKTGIVLSSTTLKRLANGEFSRLPQVATLNAIAKFLGSENWVSYRTETLQPPAPVARKRSSRRKPIAITVVGISIIALMAFFMTRTKGSLGNLDDAKFSATRTTDNSLPNTVVFDYNIDHVQADSFFIQQSWDQNRRIPIYKNHYTVTDIYYEPGFHVAKLIANDSVIREVDVSIPTDRWMFYANEQKILYKTSYINGVNPAQGTLSVSADDLVRNDIDAKEDKFYIYSYFPSKQDVSADNFTLKTKVRMKDLKNSLCPFIEIEVYCQRYYQIIKSTERGCASESLAVFGNNTIEGKKANLENITYNIREWNEIELNVTGKHVTLKINGSVAMETSYQQTAKNIAGLGFISNGLCEVDYVDFVGNDGVVVIRDDFSNSGLQNNP